jgi:hypothetical protein
MAKPIITPEEREKQRAANRRCYRKNLERNRADKRERARRERMEHPERQGVRNRRWRQRNPERAIAVSRENHAKNREQDRASTRRWQLSHVAERRAYYEAHKEEWRARWRRYYVRKRGKEIARINLRRAEKLQAIPPWADRKLIAEFYLEAQRLTSETGIKHQVDHIVPYKGVSDDGVHVVCGLHCEANLRVVTAFENLSKSNRWTV